MLNCQASKQLERWSLSKHASMDVWLYVWMHACINVCMYMGYVYTNPGKIELDAHGPCSEFASAGSEEPWRQQYNSWPDGSAHLHIQCTFM